MGRQVQKNPVRRIQVSSDFMVGSFRSLLFLIVLACILSWVSVVQAQEPAWNYSSPDGEIGGVAISPKGDLIALGAGKVIFFSKNGTVLDKEPFGTEVMMTEDGKYTVSAYSSTIYFFKNLLPSGSPGPQGATKLGEYGVSEQVHSFDVSNDGSLIAGQTVGKSLFTITTRTGVVDGNTKRADAVIKISPVGGRIIGISPTAFHFYSSSGSLSRTVTIETNSAPHTLLLSSNGNSAIFNDGQAVRWLNTNNGTERWKRQVTGSVSVLSMVPNGSVIVAGTESGNIVALDANGNSSWTYSANPGNRQSAGITCSALSDKGTLLSAGTADGKILFLNSRGELTGSYITHEYIRYIAMSTDGSVVVAASDSRMFAFFPGSSSFLPLPSPSPSSGAVPKNSTAPSPAPTPLSGQETPTVTVTEPPTTYSVIRTATQSPPGLIPLLFSLATAIALFGRRRY
jgi:hypothetical protein